MFICLLISHGSISLPCRLIFILICLTRYDRIIDNDWQSLTALSSLRTAGLTHQPQLKKAPFYFASRMKHGFTPEKNAFIRFAGVYQMQVHHSSWIT
jgi:hypothetical protein